jgi:hypothetical protein
MTTAIVPGCTASTGHAPGMVLSGCVHVAVGASVATKLPQGFEFVHA